MAFAANSVICRLALKSDSIDASSFTSIRLISGVVMFLILIGFKSKPQLPLKKFNTKNMFSASMLFLYAITFSFAYISLEAGTGALILFGSVQLTMITMSIISGHRLNILEFLGLILSFSGLTYLVYPSLSSPSFSGFVLMLISGIAWGNYTLSGKKSNQPFNDTALNFVYTIPFLIVLLLLTVSQQDISSQGIIYAILSGALASALGYTIWFKALRGLSNTEASVVQLSVPIIAAFGGLLFVSEPISQRLIFASILVLGGIFLVTTVKK